MLTSFVTEGDELRSMEEEGPSDEEVGEEEVEEDNDVGCWEASRVEIGTIRSFLALPWKYWQRLDFIGINFYMYASK